MGILGTLVDGFIKVGDAVAGAADTVNNALRKEPDEDSERRCPNNCGDSTCIGDSSCKWGWSEK